MIDFNSNPIEQGSRRINLEESLGCSNNVSPGTYFTGTSNDEQRTEEEHIPECLAVGNEYPDFESVMAAYKNHAALMGHGIRIRDSRNLVSGGRCAFISCDKYGNHNCKSSGKTKKEGCKAGLRCTSTDNKTWRVTILNTTHCHAMDPDNNRFNHSHICAIRTCASIRQLEVEAGGPLNMNASGKDCYNFVQNIRREREGSGDADTMDRMFEELANKNHNFYKKVRQNDEGRLDSVFWVDPRARAAYTEFNDVLTFDTTYLLNRYNMPFASFVGVNHHGQSILLGCTLLGNERAETFVWLFKTWLEAMGDVHPIAIMTDQDKAIAIAIAQTMSGSVHRFCLWHITEKLPVKFAGLKHGKKMCREFKEIVYNNITKVEFEEKWENFIEKHNLRRNKWLNKMYNLKEKWVPIYLSDVFLAGMLSSQRSESMHSYFDKYIHRETALYQFVEKYEMAVMDRTNKEMELDADSMYNSLQCRYAHRFENYFRNAFTTLIFRYVQAELAEMSGCEIQHEPSLNGERRVLNTEIENIKVVHRFLIDQIYPKKVVHTVTLNEQLNTFHCTCRKFETSKLLCCHIFKVTMAKEVEVLNDIYIPRRWRKDVMFAHSKIINNGAYPSFPDHIKQFKKIEKSFVEVVDLTLFHGEQMELVEKNLLSLKSALLKMSSPSGENKNKSKKKKNKTASENKKQVRLGNPKKRVATKGRNKISKKKNQTNNGTEVQWPFPSSDQLNINLGYDDFDINLAYAGSHINSGDEDSNINLGDIDLNQMP